MKDSRAAVVAAICIFITIAAIVVIYFLADASREILTEPELLVMDDFLPSEEPIPTMDISSLKTTEINAANLVTEPKEPPFTCDIYGIALPEDLQVWTTKMACKYDLNPILVLAIMGHESWDYQLDAIGDNGNSIGLMQINSVNWVTMEEQGLDIYDPAGNIEAGCYHLRSIYDDPRMCDASITDIITAYNMGVSGALNYRYHNDDNYCVYTQKVLGRFCELITEGPVGQYIEEE